jgi:hypothetical protein
MVANALWTFAMAFNVYLTFFRKYDAQQLRLLEWKYILFCYGVPFIPAFILFFVRSESRGKAYGSAVVCVSHTILLFVTNTSSCGAGYASNGIFCVWSSATDLSGS